MQNWLRRWLGLGRDRKGPRRAFRPVVEGLEGRWLLAAPVLDPIAAQTIPGGKSLFVPVTATDTDGNPLTFSATSSNPQITVTPRNGHPFLKISVAGFGDMVFQLFDDLTPRTVAIIGGLAKSEFYNNLTFHRVVPNFVIQGGDPSGNGTGGPGFTFDDEFNSSAIFSGNGQLAMANSGKDTNGSQFFVTVGPQRFLDFNHSIFGQLVRGFNVLSAINAVPTDANSKPLTPVVITSASIIQDTTDTVLTLSGPTGTGPATITVTASDGKGGTATQTFQVQVTPDTTNDPPILGPVANVVTPANTPVTINLTGTDLENDPLDFEAIVQGNPPQATATVNGNVVTVTPNAGFTGPIKVLVGVKDRGATTRGSSPDPFDTQLITVGVGDLPLTATGVAVSATEGAPATNVTVATFTDQDPNPVAGDFTASINWGDGHVSTGTVTAGTGGTLTVAGTNTYKEQGTYQVQVTITDRLGAVATTTNTATVADAMLHAQGVPVTAAVGIALTDTLVTTFTDDDPTGMLGDYTANINWGDGTASPATIAAGTAGTFNVLGSHTYSTQGTFTISVALNDVNTANDVPVSSTTATSTATVGQPVATTNAVTLTPTPSVFGQRVALTATVTPVPPGSGTPTGTVTFRDGTTTLGSSTLNASGAATFSTSSLTAGTHSITAVYAGAGIFTASTSTAVTQTVNKAGTTATVTSSTNPSTSGQATTFTAVVTATAPASGTPTGTVTFRDGTTVLGSATLNSTGRATFQTSTLTVGTHTITAVYAGDGNFNTSTSAALTQTVGAATGTPNQRFVGQLFRDLLGRAAEPAAMSAFSTVLDQNTMNRAQVATAILTSDEGRTREIQNLYQTFLSRQADSVGMDLSLRYLKSRGTLQKLRATIVGSNEYFQSRSGGSNDRFLTNLYRDALGRAIDPVGQSLASQALAQGVDRTKVADVVFGSPEGRQVLVQSFYTLLLHRTADPTGLNAAAAALARGIREEQVLVAIGVSDEYFSRT